MHQFSGKTNNFEFFGLNLGKLPNQRLANHSNFMKYVFKTKEIKVIKPDMCKLNLTAFSANQVCFAGKIIRAYGLTFGTALDFFNQIACLD